MKIVWKRRGQQAEGKPSLTLNLIVSVGLDPEVLKMLSLTELSGCACKGGNLPIDKVPAGV
jgi:hypothetical protein